MFGFGGHVLVEGLQSFIFEFQGIILFFDANHFLSLIRKRGFNLILDYLVDSGDVVLGFFKFIFVSISRLQLSK